MNEKTLESLLRTGKSYYANAYNNDLTLKANPKIKMIRYNFVESLADYLY